MPVELVLYPMRIHSTPRVLHARHLLWLVVISHLVSLPKLWKQKAEREIT